VSLAKTAEPTAMLFAGVHSRATIEPHITWRPRTPPPPYGKEQFAGDILGNIWACQVADGQFHAPQTNI